MRKIYILLNFFLVIMLCEISYSQEQEKYPCIGFIKNDQTNIRSGYNLNFEGLCQVSKGDRVKVLGKSYGWYKILLPKGACSYIKKEYVSSDDGIGIVNAANVNVRAKPGTNSTIIGQLDKGNKVKIVEKLEGWYKIQPKNFIGWVYSDLVTFTPLETKPERLEKQEKEETIIEKEKILKELEAGSEQPSKLIVRGLLLGTGRTFNRPGTHKLILDSKNFYYLKSDKLNLDSFINREVEVKGTLVKMKGDKPHFISVESVEVIK